MANVVVRKSAPSVENLKQGLEAHLRNQGINNTNFVAHLSVSIWRKIYEEDFQVWGLGESEALKTEPNHVVYADHERVICWLWNHKDSKETSIDSFSKKILFFIDGFDPIQVKQALHLLIEKLEEIGAVSLKSGVLNRSTSSTQIDVQET